jgi:hypothetical protein
MCVCMHGFFMQIEDGYIQAHRTVVISCFEFTDGCLS